MHVAVMQINAPVDITSVVRIPGRAHCCSSCCCVVVIVVVVISFAENASARLSNISDWIRRAAAGRAEPNARLKL